MFESPFANGQDFEPSGRPLWDIFLPRARHLGQFERGCRWYKANHRFDNTTLVIPSGDYRFAGPVAYEAGHLAIFPTLELKKIKRNWEKKGVRKELTIFFFFF